MSQQDLFAKFDEMCRRREAGGGELEETARGAPPQEQAEPTRMAWQEAASLGNADDSLRGVAGAAREDGFEEDEEQEVLRGFERPSCSVAEWKQRLRQLGVQVAALASDANRALSNPRSMPRDFLEELKVEAESLREERDQWEDDLYSGLTKVRKRVGSLGENLRYSAAGGECMRQIVLGAERDMSVFKEGQRQQFDALHLLETTLLDTLEQMEARFERWAEQPSALTKAARDAHQESIENRAPRSRPQVQTGAKGRNDDPELERLRDALEALDAEIEHDGGNSGRGWTLEDHNTYLRCRRKYKMSETGAGHAALVEQVQELLLLSHEDVVEHMNWHATYEERLTEKRRLLQKWKERRVAVLVPAQSEERPEATEQELEEEKRLRKEAMTRAQAARQQNKQAIKEWKKQKAEEAERERVRQEQREQTERRKEREQLRAQVAQREALQAYKAQRRTEEALLSAQMSQQRGLAGAQRRSLSLEDRKRIKRRGDELFEKKLRLAEKRATLAGPPIAGRPGTPNPVYAGVASRLYDHTESYIQKIRPPEEDVDELLKGVPTPSKYGKVPGNFADQGLMRRVRQEPSWRQG